MRTPMANKSIAVWLQKRAVALRENSAGVIYVKTPCGIGCGIDEALSLYKTGVFPVGAREDQLNIVTATTKNGGRAQFMVIWSV